MTRLMVGTLTVLRVGVGVMVCVSVGTESTDFPASGGSVTSLTQHISKQDISNPTRTAGPLFSTGHTLDSDEEDNLQAMSSSEQREKVGKGCGLSTYNRGVWLLIVCYSRLR